MTYKLFDVLVHYNALVVADNYDDAYFKARDLVGEIVYREEPEIEVVDEIENITSEWSGTIPYGGDGVMTCDQILAMTSEEKKEKLIDEMSDEVKKRILSKMTLSDIVNLLNKPVDELAH